MAPFYLLDVKIEPETNSITKNGKRRKVEPKIMQVLMCLVQARGRVVSKEDLLDQVWAETVVVEMVLTRAISELRSAFGDKSTDPHFIETISKSGYRLVAEVGANKKFPKARRLRQAVVPLLVLGTLTILASQFLPLDPPPATSTTHLTTDKGWEYHPSISPDGRWVAHVSQANNQYSDIYLRSLAVDSVLQLTQSDGYFLKPIWSPDGNSVAAFGTSPEGKGIHLYSVENQRLMEVIEIETRFVGLAWAPSGEAISYVGFDSINGRHAVHEYSFLDKTSSIQIPSQPGSWGDSEPKYSPDGSSLAFIRTVAEGNQDIYRMDLVTATVQRITSINRSINGYDWESSENLLVSSNFDGCGDLWKVPVAADGSAPLRIIKIPYGESIQNPTISNGILVGEHWKEDTDLVAGYLHSDSAIDLNLNSTLWELHPDFSPDGKFLVFSSNRSGSYEIWKANLSNGLTTRLTDLKQGFSGKPKFSDDGSQIVFESNASGKHQIYLLDMAGDMVQITTENADYINPSWSPDGMSVYCASNLQGEWNSWQFDIPSSQGHRITNGGAYFLQQMNNGRKFFSKINNNGIWELTPKGREIKIFDTLNSVDWGNWQIAEEGIYYLNRNDQVISYYQFASGDHSEQVSLNYGIPSGDPSFAINEKTGFFLIGHITNYSGDLIAIRNF